MRPSGSTFITFHPPSLPRDVEICHKFDRGFVDLQLRGMGNRLNEVRAILGEHLEADMQLVQISKSAAVRITVPILKANIPAEEQETNLRLSLQTATTLLRWFLSIRNFWLSRGDAGVFTAGAKK